MQQVASIFKESVRWYVEQHPNTALGDYGGLLVDIGNKYAQQVRPASVRKEAIAASISDAIKSSCLK